MNWKPVWCLLGCCCHRNVLNHFSSKKIADAVVAMDNCGNWRCEFFSSSVFQSLTKPFLSYNQYLVEVKRSDNRPIPDNWILHSKYVLRVIKFMWYAVLICYTERKLWRDTIRPQSEIDWTNEHSIVKSWRSVCLPCSCMPPGKKEMNKLYPFLIGRSKPGIPRFPRRDIAEILWCTARCDQ